MRPSRSMIKQLAVLFFAIPLFSLGFMIQSTTAQEITFWEEFALSANRVEALEKLVPGSEDYYFFHCMHYQNQDQLDQVESMLKKWLKRHGRTQLVQQIENRQALLRYSEDPRATLNFLTDRLNLSFTHQRQIPRAQRDLPTELDPALVDIKKLLARALRRDSNSLGRIDDDGLLLLADTVLNTRQRRDLLNRLTVPNFPNLVDLIAKDLKSTDSRGFSSLKIHTKLTREQMDQLVEKIPALKNEKKFVYEYLLRLHPNEDIDWRVDRTAYREYLDGIWKYVKTLGSDRHFRSLKACILFHKLQLDLDEGKYNKSLFLEYLEMPRNASYLNKDFLKKSRRTNPPINLTDDFRKFIHVLPISDDEALVREYLHHFLVKEPNTKQYEPYLSNEYLKQQFATAKILNGIGDQEAWASMLTPDEYKSLRERIDIEFDRTNPEFFGVDDNVEIKLYTKNVDKLILKVFEINTANYYKQLNREVDTDVNLDGLVANFEQSFEYDDSPFARKLRTIKLDQIKKRGVYVVDFIGGGKSSRALIRKGRLQMIGRTTLAGQRFNVFNESSAVVLDASIWIAGRQHTADEKGNIDVPFSTRPSRQNAVISQGNFACLQTFDQVAEKFSFDAAFYVDRESLTRDNQADVIIRPSLRVAGNHPVPVAMIKNARLEITSTNLDGITTTKTVEGVELTKNGETVVSFNVPPRLRQISFALFGTVENSIRKKQNLVARDAFAVNIIDLTDEIQDVHLLPTNKGYYLEVLGKTGEVRAKQPVRIQFKFSGLRDKVNVDLQSDKNGLIGLGELSAVESMKATVAGGSERNWNLRTPGQHLFANYHILSGEDLRISLPNDIKTVNRANVSLYEVRAHRLNRDCFDKISAAQGAIKFAKLEPGNYVLRFHSRQLAGRLEPIMIRVVEGMQAAEVLVGKKRVVENRPSKQPYIFQAKSADDKVTIQLEHITDSTRVHVFTSRYQNPFDPFSNLSSVRAPEPWVYMPSIRRSAYMEGRTIGEEFQYILNRRYLKRYPGNMLERPSLLLNPWAVQETMNQAQVAALGDKYDIAGTERDGKKSKSRSARKGQKLNNDFANVDYLGESNAVMLNVKPNKDGTISLTKEQIGNAQNITVVAVDAFSVASTKIYLPLKKLAPVDQRLASALDPTKHFSQSKQVKLLSAGQSLTIEDLISSRVQHYDELSDVFELFKTFGRDSGKLQKFEFVLDWNDKKQEEKQSLYSEYACHELNFFLMKKDPKFFKSVVLPHLEHKREKTFVDHYLLDHDLTEYLSPWKFARLNVVERILLSQRIEERRDDLVHNIGDLYSISPTPRLEFDRLYNAAMVGLSMDRGIAQQLRRKRRNEDRESLGRMSELSTAEEAMEQDAIGDGVVMGGAVISGGGMGGGMGGAGGGMAPESAPAPNAPRDVSKFFDMDDASESQGQAKDVRKQRTSRLRADSVEEETVQLGLELRPGDDSAGRQLFESQMAMLGEKAELAKPLYRPVEPTREWMENNYYQLLPTQQNTDLVQVNRFWRDYANHQSGEFLSSYFAEASRNFTEVMFALSVLDLPLKNAKENIEFVDGTMTIKADTPMIVLHQQNTETPFERGETKLLVSENFFQKDDRYRYEGSVQYDKFITGDFLAHMLYGSQVVITNPTSTPMSVEVLTQIPQGALSASGSQETRTIQFELPAFSTQRFEYSFYFPSAGEFTHYPAHVSSDGNVVAVADSSGFNVIDKPTELDIASWAWVSQNGTEDQVIDFLNEKNVLRLDLDSIAFRMQDKAFFARAVETLRRRYIYNHTLWSYSVKHNDEQAISEFLSHADGITTQCGLAFDSPILKIDPVERNWFEHREYWPLVNSRAHRLGPQRKILNPNFFAQYDKLMRVLANKSELNSDDHLVVTYFMLLQDRIETALDHFEKVSTDKIEAKMQYDYCDAYLDLYREKPDVALSKARKWENYPVDHWRARFENVIAMVNEINGDATTVVDEKNQMQQQTAMAAQSSSFDFSIESRQATVNYLNVTELTINYYEMDIELLFSRNPFSRDQLDGFSLIRPNLTKTVSLAADGKAAKDGKGTYEFELPDAFKNKNVLVEIVSGDKTRAQAYFAHSLDVQVLENYGQVHVTQQSDTKSQAVSKAYVKVYSRHADGTVEFHKDGYTDLRGRFDFVSQSNRGLGGIVDYSILIMSDELGAVIREAKPPLE